VTIAGMTRTLFGGGRRRGLAAAVLLLLVGVGGDAEAKKKKAKKGPKVPSAGWEVLVTAGASTTLLPENPEHSGGGAQVLSVRNVATEGDLTTACIGEGDGCTVSVAVGPKGVWLAPGQLTPEELKQPPTFGFGERGWKDAATDLSVEVSADGEVCYRWSNTKYECEDVCFWSICVAPGQGVVMLDGTASPDMLTWRADDPTCVTPDVDTTWSDITGTSAVACAAGDCRRVDLTTGRWQETTPPEETIEGGSVGTALPAAIPGVLGSVSLSTVSDDGRSTSSGLAAIVTVDEGAGKTRLYTIDVAKAAVLGPREIAADTYVGYLAFIEGFLVVRSAACAGPCDQYDLYEPRKLKHRGTIGGKDPVEGGVPPIRIKGSLYAYVDGWGSEVAFVDMKKGKLKKRVKLDAIAPQLGPDARPVKVDAGLAILYSPLVTADGRGGVAVVTPKGKLLRRAILPACADPARRPK
jgi:hypothetical protein